MGRPDRRGRYLLPYAQAHKEGARGVRALLWEDRRSQEVRFEALVRLCPLADLRILDVGCGRADFLGYLRGRGIAPAHYTGLEAQPWLVRAARRRRYEDCTIVQGDFVEEGANLRGNADVVVFSGSLNLLSSRQFYRCLGIAWQATRRFLAFNFLCSPTLADSPELVWHHRRSVLAFARRETPHVRVEDGYEEGDCTVVMKKGPPWRSS